MREAIIAMDALLAIVTLAVAASAQLDTTPPKTQAADYVQRKWQQEKDRGEVK